MTDHYQIDSVEFTYPNAKKATLATGQFGFPKKGVTLLHGKNGSGKTTLFKLLSGLIKHDHNQGYTYLTDDFFVFHVLTVEETLNLAYQLSKVQQVSLEQLQAILQPLELNDFMSNRVQDLSYGQKQKLRLACSFLVGGQVILLDEPTNGLDRQSLDAMNGILHEMGRYFAIVVIAHDAYRWLTEPAHRLKLSKTGVISDDTSEL